MIKVTFTKVKYVPNGLYCTNCPSKKESSSVLRKNHFYCNEYGDFLNEDKKGRCLKAEQCLLNLRKALKRMDKQ